MKWIKTSERLPELYVTVAVTIKDDEGIYSTAASLQYLNPITWEHGIHEFGADEIIAWMPLPEPYTEETNEQ